MEQTRIPNERKTMKGYYIKKLNYSETNTITGNQMP
jgi:hypothetical protein